jgi:hypothetical protein
MLLTTVDLTDNMHGLTDVVVESEEEDRGVHHSRRLVVERPEELYKIARVRSDRAESTRELESRARLFFIGGRRLQHVPHGTHVIGVSVRLQGQYRCHIEVGRPVRGSAA